jgi:hypothetical protein
MPIDAVFGDIDFGIKKPFEFGFLKINLEYFFPFLIPSKILIGYFVPELAWFANGLIVHFEVMLKVVYFIVTHADGFFLSV